MNKKTIFIVDDAEMMRITLHNALSGDYTLMAMDSADKLINMLPRVKPDLILLDYYMPGLSCRDTMKRLKENYAEIPIIIMSGSNYPELLDEIFAMGAADFVPKPIDDKISLVEKIEKLLAAPRD